MPSVRLATVIAPPVARPFSSEQPMSSESPDLLLQIYQIVDELLSAYDRSSTIHTVAPFITLLRVWRDAINQALDAADDHHVPRDGVPG